MPSRAIDRVGGKGAAGDVANYLVVLSARDRRRIEARLRRRAQLDERRRRYDAEDRRLARELYERGATRPELADAFGVSRQAVWLWTR